MCAAQLCGRKLELCKAVCTVYEGRDDSGVGVCPAWGTVVMSTRSFLVQGQGSWLLKRSPGHL